MKKTLAFSLLAFCFSSFAQSTRLTENTTVRASVKVVKKAQASKDQRPSQGNEDAVSSGASTSADPQLKIQRSTLRETVDADVMKGYKALEKNQFAQAREAYSRVLTNNPTQRDALLGIAYAHHALGSTDQATATLKRLLELYPRDSDATSALYLIGGGDLATEESRFKQLLDRNESPAVVYYTLGVLYFEQSRYGEAERSFARAVSLSPNQPDYAFNWALSLDQLSRSREAAKQYVVALNLANQTNAVFSRDVARARLRILTATP